MAGKGSRGSGSRGSGTKGSSGGTRGRSAITGRFVTPGTVKRHPKTTVSEKVKPKDK